MAKTYKRYKNTLERFLGSEKGKRYFNFLYSWGASIVILGALFKINHWKYGTEILLVGMIVEAIIFFFSAFDLPSREYKWDRVFPNLNRIPDADAQAQGTQQPVVAGQSAPAGDSGHRTAPAAAPQTATDSKGRPIQQPATARSGGSVGGPAISGGYSGGGGGAGAPVVVGGPAGGGSSGTVVSGGRAGGGSGGTIVVGGGGAAGGSTGTGGGAVVVGGGSSAGGSGTVVVGGAAGGGTTGAGGTVVVGGGGLTGRAGASGQVGGSAGMAVSHSGGVIAGGVVGGGSNVQPMEAEDVEKMKEAQDKYTDKLKKMTETMDKFTAVTNSLTEVSDTLLNSFKTITDNSTGIRFNSDGYVKQLETLNRNLTGLNTIYEIQLKGISGQINTIEQINAGLERIKSLYSGSLSDSAVFRTETQKMAQQLAEINQVYTRLLQAMTTNMNMTIPGVNPAVVNTQNNNPTQSK